MLQTPTSTGGARRDSLPFSETGSLGDDNTSPVVEFFREEVKEEAPPAPPPRSWLGGLGSYFKPARAPPPPPVDGYEDDSPPSRHDTPPLLMRHAPTAALDVQLSTRSTAPDRARRRNAERTRGRRLFGRSHRKKPRGFFSTNVSGGGVAVGGFNLEDVLVHHMATPSKAGAYTALLSTHGDSKFHRLPEHVLMPAGVPGIEHELKPSKMLSSAIAECGRRTRGAAG